MNPQELLQENTQLQGQVQTLANENLTLQTDKQSLESQLLSANSQLHTANSQLEWLKRQLFGKRSEKVMSDEESKQLMFEGFEIEVPEKEEKSSVKGHSRKRNKGKDTITLPTDLPIEKQVIDLPEEEKICPKTNKPLEKIGEEITSKLAYKPGSYFIKQIIRPKYSTLEGSILSRLALEGFEPCDGKLSCRVFRGESQSNLAFLLGGLQ